MISIIIPVYNVEEYIGDCILSVLAQSLNDYEVVLIDDCGQDKSISIVEKIIGDDVRFVILHHEKNRGLSAARNTGLAVAKGEYVFFMDSDDTLEPNCLEQLYSLAELTHSDVTVGNVNVVGCGDSLIPILNSDIPTVLSEHNKILNSYLNGEWYVMAWNKLIRKDFLIKNNIFFVEGLLHEDNPWSFEVSCTANRVAFVKNNTYNYLVRDNSLQTGKDFDKHYKAYMKIMSIIADVIQKKKLVNYTRWWFERQKALFFAMTQEKGTKHQQKEMYLLIHKLLPCFLLEKENLHYFFPPYFGYVLYRKFYRYHLC